MKRIYAMFANQDDAADAFERLKEIGYADRDISVVARRIEETEAVEGEGGTKAAESAASGAMTGGVVGGLAGLLIGIGALAVPGVGALLVAGPIAAALGLTGAAAATASGAITGALAGGLIGALVGLGVPEEKARMYETRIKEGGVLLAVDAKEENEEEVKNIFQSEGAADVAAV